jgi:hypothetical protein
LKTPYGIRDEAMNDLLKAYQPNFAKGNNRFKIKYKSKKNESWWQSHHDIRAKLGSESIVIHFRNWKGAGFFFPTIFGKKPIESAEPLPKKFFYDSLYKIIYILPFIHSTTHDKNGLGMSAKLPTSPKKNAGIFGNVIHIINLIEKRVLGFISSWFPESFLSL